MIPWIQIYSNLPTHPKTARLAEELGLASQQVSPNVIATGLLISLWTWAIQNAYDGDLSKCSPRLIADVCRWRRKPEALVSALQAAGFLEADMRLHDWDSYAGLLMEALDNKKENDKRRAREYRRRRKEREAASVTGASRDDAVTARG